MPSVISVIIIAIMLGVLAVMPTVVLGDELSAWLLKPTSGTVLSVILALVVLSFGLLFKYAKRPWRSWLASGLVLVMIGLFALRAMMAHHAFEQSAIKQTYTVTATVHLDEISDGIYDEFTASTYRQAAILTQLSAVTQLSHHANDAVVLANPFVAQGATDVFDGDAIDLPDEMSVLLMARPSVAKNLPQLDELTPNTTARMTLVLEPITTQKSASGFDTNVWLRTRHIHATAQIIAIDRVDAANDERLGTYLQVLRQKLRTHFYQGWHGLDIASQQARAVTLSLLTGDRALISRQTKDLYQLAGISHLLAISGTHVVFLALILAGVVTWLLDRSCPRFYMTVARWQIRLGVMVLASLIYAMFTGFDVPAVRTVYMLGVMAVVRYLVLPVSDFTLLFVVGLILAWLDPYVLWQAGFWLSFVAVLLLMRYETAMMAGGVSQWRRTWQDLQALIKLQVWLFIAMLPVSLLFFGKVSLWGLLTNLFAVGLFGVVIVPINLLAGVVFVLSPDLADGLWGVSSLILLYLHDGFEIFLFGDSWLYAPFGAVGFLLGVLALVPFIFKSLPKYWAALPVSVLCLMVLNHAVHFHPKYQQQTHIMPIVTDNQALYALLVQHDKQAWLMLSDFGIRSVSDGEFETLIGALRRQGVAVLTGVVVQTPSRQLPMMVAQIHERIPIERYWQAGRSEVVLSHLIKEPCQAGKSYDFDDLSIRAVTGWHQIDDESVWGCSLEVQSDKPIRMSSQAGESDGDELVVNRVLINGAHHDNTWQLWQWLCYGQANANIMPKPASSMGLWLSHDRAKDNADVRQRFMVQ